MSIYLVLEGIPSTSSRYPVGRGYSVGNTSGARTPVSPALILPRLDAQFRQRQSIVGTPVGRGHIRRCEGVAGHYIQMKNLTNPVKYTLVHAMLYVPGIGSSM